VRALTWYDKLLFFAVFALDVAGAGVLLLLLRRWTRRWWAAVAGTVVLTPFAAFYLTGGVAWLATYFRVVVRGDTSIPDEIGRTVPQYLDMTFHVCGYYGVLFAIMGSGLSLPLVGVWRLAHPASFKRFTRCEPVGTDAERAAAPDRRD